MKKTNEVIFLIGIPGSGKSTYLNNVLLPKKEGYVVCSSDNIFEAKASAMGITYDEAYHSIPFKEVEKEFKATMLQAVKDKQNVIVDRTNLGANARRKFLSYFPKTYTKTAILFDFSDLNEIRKRLDERSRDTGKTISEKTLSEMLEMYTEPSREEFDKIIIL